MLPGPTIIRECPHCKGHFKESTIASGNTFGARYWTDGKMEADMLPEVDWLVVCPNCLAPVWVDFAAEVGRIARPFRQSEGDYQGADELEYGHAPTVESYLIALKDETLPAEDQTYIRFRLWRLWNDPRRNCANVDSPLKTYEIANLEALLKLIDGSDLNELVARAEINRELGRFEDALNLLNWPDKSSDGPRIKFIRQLAEQKNRTLQEFED